MNGTWKDDVSGWNNKDTRRKKQTRKTYLKDRGLYLSRKEPLGIVRYESTVEHIEEEYKYKRSGFVETWKIEVETFVRSITNWNSIFVQNICSTNIRTAYNFNGVWYDEYTNEIIKGTVKKLDFLWKKEIEIDQPKKVPKRRNWVWSRYSSSNKMFINNKPVESWFRWTWYDDGKRRKVAQKIANSKDKTALRNWIAKEDWDAEIKTHALSKSIAWEVY